VPPSITQTDYHFTLKDGIKITGFKIECDPLEAMGTYYLYFDDIRAVSDLFGEARRDTDDMTDGWERTGDPTGSPRASEGFFLSRPHDIAL
jgi:hypothetical protein